MMAEMEMAGHIAAHSLRVWQVALAIAQNLAAPGRSINSHRPLNLQLVEAGALLHDITKTRSLTTGENHAASARSLLADMGMPEIARLVGQHVTLDAYPPRSLDETVIVNYADKRVNHDQVVTLARRGEYILATYGASADRRRRIRQLWERTTEIEARLFKRLPFSPQELVSYLDPAAFEAHLGHFRRWARLDL